VQDGGSVEIGVDFGWRARTGMVSHHAPALSGSHIHIGGGDESDLRAFRGVNFHPLYQVVNRTGDGF